MCYANRKYYLVSSSFQNFPGGPLFESEDLVNWKRIGHVLTRKSQVMLEKIASSGGVFAPTIRYNNERFYMVMPVTEEVVLAEIIYLGSTQTKHVAKEVSEGFIGVLLGLYAVGKKTAEFTNFSVTYSEGE